MNKKIFIITILMLVLLTACKATDVEDTAMPGSFGNEGSSEAESNIGNEKENAQIVTDVKNGKENIPSENTGTDLTDNKTDTSEEYNWEEQEEEIDILTKLKKEYPNATITEENGKYSVISDNIDITTITERERHGMSDRHIYTSMDELFSDLNPIRDSVFIGKKTGETKQYIPINSKGQVDGLYYTNSKVEVQKVFYGDISEGDIITIREFYAVFGGEKEKLLYTLAMPLSQDESFYTISKNTSEKSLFGDTFYYPLYEGCFKVETAKSIVESGVKLEYSSDALTQDTYDIIKRDMYTKYIVNEDTALDKEVEIAKAQKWAEGMEKTLTDEQLAKIDELCKKYGEVKK